jgi:DNA modification methylase
MPLVGEMYRTERATLVQGDCLDVLRCLEDGEADALVTDPPSGTGFMQRKWDSFKSRDAFVDFLTSRLVECRRVCRPGAVGLVWALPRTSHWTALAIEEAGWVIEEKIYHLFGTGFPKAKHRLKPAAEEWVLCRNPGPLWLGIDECRLSALPYTQEEWNRMGSIEGKGAVRMGQAASPVTKAAYQNGLIPVPSGRWPANLALSHHPECVCQGTKKVKSGNGVRGASTSIYGGGKGFTKATGEQVGYADADDTETIENWTCHPDCPIRLLDEQAGERRSYCSNQATAEAASGKEFVNKNRAVYELSKSNGKSFVRGRMYADKGGASRFYANFPAEEDTSRMLYCSKASKKDRGEGNRHNTVKSTTLMSWLVKLACPEGGLVLDPFAGSGSTGVACLRVGRRFLGIELDVESCSTSVRRLKAEE